MLGMDPTSSLTNISSVHLLRLRNLDTDQLGNELWDRSGCWPGPAEPSAQLSLVLSDVSRTPTNCQDGFNSFLMHSYGKFNIIYLLVKHELQFPPKLNHSKDYHLGSYLMVSKLIQPTFEQ